MSIARSANEIEALVLKAARGGGLPVGLAEDLAAAAAFLDLEALSSCPCQTGGGAFEIPVAIDAVLSWRAAPSVVVPSVVVSEALIAAYCAAVSRHIGQTLHHRATPDGYVIEYGESNVEPQTKGRRAIPAALEAHLNDMAAKLLVPESAASRAAGAGAGLTDND